MKPIVVALIVTATLTLVGSPVLADASRAARAGQPAPGAALLSQAAPADTLRLGQIQQAAVDRDPRARQLSIQETNTALRLRNLSAERFPALAIRSQLSHQSEVPAIPISGPNFNVPTPPKDRLEISLEAQQLLYDGGTLEGRRRVEEAELRAEQARIAASLFPLRSEVNEAFFQALLLQERDEEIGTLIEDLNARLALVRAQVQEGAALPGDTALVRAEMLRAMLTRLEAAADRRAALGVLEVLTGRNIGDDGVLLLPEVSAAFIEWAGTASPSNDYPLLMLGQHPQYLVFASQRERLEQQSLIIAARTRPQLSAFGQLAYGRPGFEQFTDDLHEYWTGGLRFSWQPWNWGTTQRDREVISNQRAVLNTEEAAFTEQMFRQLQDETQAIRRLRASVTIDDQIVVLREQIERQATAQLAERAIPPAEYVDARTDLQEARLARQRHQIELARAWVRYMTTLGSPIR